MLVLVGLFTRCAAAAGLGLNLVLFLTASWKTCPYFLGSDIVFVFAWLPFVLAGAAANRHCHTRSRGRLGKRTRDEMGPVTSRSGGGTPALPSPAAQLLGQALGAIGAATLGIAAISAGSPRGATRPPAHAWLKGSRRDSGEDWLDCPEDQRGAQAQGAVMGAVRLEPAGGCPVRETATATRRQRTRPTVHPAGQQGR